MKTIACALIVLAASAAMRSASNQGPASNSGQPNAQFDLLIKNGRVIDPANGIDVVTDVAVAGAKIARVAANIDPAQALRVVDATGLHVVPGLIDIHSHVFFGTEKDAYLSNADTAVQPDSHSFRSGQTTLVDVGGAGWRNFGQFKEQVIDRAQNARALVHQHRRFRDEGWAGRAEPRGHGPEADGDAYTTASRA